MFNIASIIISGSIVILLSFDNEYSSLPYFLLFLYIFQCAFLEKISKCIIDIFLNGGDKGSRTLDLLLARQAL